MKQFLQKRRLLRVLMIILIVILCLVLAAFLFVKLYRPFGATATAKEQQNYAERAGNFYDGIFHNDGDFSIMGEFTDPYAERAGEKGELPKDELPTKAPTLRTDLSVEDLTITWFGHSTLLIQMHGMNILIDPVFSELASPVAFTGTRRYSPLPIEAEQLPDIDICIFSHDHYDHLDYGTIKKIDEKVSRYVVPLGVENHLEKFGVEAEKITNMAWWEEQVIAGLTVACAPSRHYSGRVIIDNNQSLWASWVLMDEYHRVYESGDSGFGSQFEEIHEKYGDMDLALMDCAQYNESWHDVHMFPEEAVEAAGRLGAKTVMPIHWGAFRLANHAWDDPAERFTNYAEELGIRCITPMLGETAAFENAEQFQSRWWRSYK